MKSKMQQLSDTFSVNTDEFYDDYDFESETESTIRSKSPSAATNIDFENLRNGDDKLSSNENSFESNSSKSKSSVPEKNSRASNGHSVDQQSYFVESRISNGTKTLKASRSSRHKNDSVATRSNGEPAPARKGWQRNTRSTGYGATVPRPGYSVRGGPARGSVSRPPQNQVAKRVMSAKRKNFSEIQNQVNRLEMELERLQLENKDLKKTTRLQERALQKLDNEEAELPRLIQKHNNEIRILREKAKKSKEASDRSFQELKKKDAESLRQKDKIKRLQDIVEGKNLYQREKINKQLEELKEQLAEKDNNISELQKSIVLHAKVRQREIKEKNEKYRRMQEDLKQLQERHVYLQERLKDKERELDRKNIYTQAITQKKRQDGWRNNDSPLSYRQASAASHQLNSYLTQSASSTAEARPSNAVKVDIPQTKEADTSNVSEPERNGSVSPISGRQGVETMVGKQRKMSQKPVDYEQELKARLEAKIRQEIEHEKELRDMEERRIREELHQREIKLRVEEDIAMKLELQRSEHVKKEGSLEDLELNIKREMEGKLVQQNQRLAEKEKARLLELEMREREAKLRIEHEEEEKEEHNKEFEEANRKKMLLLERMRAIDEGKDPNSVEVSSVATPAGKSNGTDRDTPIFLQSNRIETNNKKNETYLGNSAPDPDPFKSKTNGSAGNGDLVGGPFDNVGKKLDDDIPTFANERKRKPTIAKTEEIVFGSYRPSLGVKDTEPESNVDASGRPFYGRRGGPQGNLTVSGKQSDDARSPSPVFDLSASPSKNRINQPRQRHRPAGNVGIFGEDLFSESEPNGNAISPSAANVKGSDTNGTSYQTDSRSSSGGSRTTRLRHTLPYEFNTSTSGNINNNLGAFDDGVEELILL